MEIASTKLFNWQPSIRKYHTTHIAKSTSQVQGEAHEALHTILINGNLNLQHGIPETDYSVLSVTGLM